MLIVLHLLFCRWRENSKGVWTRFIEAAVQIAVMFYVAPTGPSECLFLLFFFWWVVESIDTVIFYKLDEGFFLLSITPFLDSIQM